VVPAVVISAVADCENSAPRPPQGRQGSQAAGIAAIFYFASLIKRCCSCKVRGLRGVVCFGDQPAVVPEWLIGELKQRCEHGPVELPERMFVPHERVMVIDGPFREFEGIFQRYLSGSERVAILFSTIGAGVRAVLPASMGVPVV